MSVPDDGKRILFRVDFLENLGTEGTDDNVTEYLELANQGFGCKEIVSGLVESMESGLDVVTVEL